MQPPARHFHHDTRRQGLRKKDSSQWTAQPALCRVSRELRRETLPVYYGANEFVILAATKEDHYRRRFEGINLVVKDLHDIKKWLRCIGQENVRLLRYATVRTLFPVSVGRVIKRRLLRDNPAIFISDAVIKTSACWTGVWVDVDEGPVN